MRLSVTAKSALMLHLVDRLTLMNLSYTESRSNDRTTVTMTLRPGDRLDANLPIVGNVSFLANADGELELHVSATFGVLLGRQLVMREQSWTADVPPRRRLIPEISNGTISVTIPLAGPIDFEVER